MQTRFAFMKRFGWLGAGGALCVAFAAVVVQTNRPQGDAPPAAPTVSEWNALPPDAFTYQATEIRIGDPNTDLGLYVWPTAINNAGQVVGSCDREPAPPPIWWRKIIHLPFVTRFITSNSYQNRKTAFFWDKGRTEILPGLGRSQVAEAVAINDNGQIAGNAQPEILQPRFNGVPVKHAVLWNDYKSAPRDLTASFGALSNMAFGINARGQVGIQARGDRPDPQNPRSVISVLQPFLWDGGVLRPLTPETEAYGLNDQGEAVGVWSGVPAAQRAGIWGGAPVVLTAENAPVILSVLLKTEKTSSAPYRINNRGEIIGDDSQGPFLLRNGRMERLRSGTPAGLYDDRIFALNQNGDAVCYKETGPHSGVGTLFLWREGRFFDINALLGPHPQWAVDIVLGMNDRGQLIGWGYPTDPSRLIRRHTNAAYPEWIYRHPLVLTPVLSKTASSTPKH